MEPANPLLPALRPDTPALLRRTGSLLGAVQGIQQEASAEYWFELGLANKRVEKWQQALFCFDRVIKLDDTHWRGWLLAALVCAHLAKVEQCRENIFGAEIYGRPMKEADFFNFYDSSDLSRLSNFLNEHKGKDNSYYSLVALALIHFHSRNRELAEQLLSEVEAQNTEEVAWKQYFLSRIEFEKGNIEESVTILKPPLLGGLAENPRTLFWVGRSCILRVVSLDDNYRVNYDEKVSPWVVYGQDGEEYLPPELQECIDFGIQCIEKAIGIGPASAEYYFTLGRAKQLLNHGSGWGGAGLREYYAAVELEPENEEYIMARYGAMYFSGPWNTMCVELIACAAAVAIRPDDKGINWVTMNNFYFTDNFASYVILFNKFYKHTEREEMVIEAIKEEEKRSLEEWVASLGGLLSVGRIQKLADAEQANWRELVKLESF